jgi:GAF domain-containing protein
METIFMREKLGVAVAEPGGQHGLVALLDLHRRREVLKSSREALEEMAQQAQVPDRQRTLLRAVLVFSPQ